VCGPNTPCGKGYLSFALPFTPTANAHVSEVEAAIEYVSGASQVNLSLYADSHGVPGTILAGPSTVINLPTAGTCCASATWNLATPLPVTAHVRYWIVADTPTSGTGSDLFGVWQFVHTTFYIADHVNGIWVATAGADQQFAAAVFGTIP